MTQILTVSRDAYPLRRVREDQRHTFPLTTSRQTWSDTIYFAQINFLRILILSSVVVVVVVVVVDVVAAAPPREHV